jgi:hypothetical protein
MHSSDPKGKRISLCALVANEQPDGHLGLAPLSPNGYRLILPQSDPATPEVGAEGGRGLGLGICPAVLRDDSGIEASNVLRSNVAVCRFRDLDAEDVAGLDPRPDVAIALGGLTWCLWKLTTPASPDELIEIQAGLLDAFGGDPEWDASPVELVPLPGVLYVVGGEEVEAVELEIAA